MIAIPLWKRTHRLHDTLLVSLTTAMEYPHPCRSCAPARSRSRYVVAPMSSSCLKVSSREYVSCLRGRTRNHETPDAGSLRASSMIQARTSCSRMTVRPWRSRSAISRFACRTICTASFRFSLASSRVAPCVLAPGNSSTKPIHMAPCCSKTAVNFSMKGLYTKFDGFSTPRMAAAL